MGFFSNFSHLWDAPAAAIGGATNTGANQSSGIMSQASWDELQREKAMAPGGSMSDPTQTGVARKLTPQEATQYYLDNPDRMTKPGMQANPYPAGSPQWIAEAQMRSGSQAPIGNTPPPTQPMSPMAPVTQMPNVSGSAMIGGLRGGATPLGMPGPADSSGGPLSSLWQASRNGTTVPNQPYQPFSGQAPQPQQNSRFGMPQQSTAGTGSGYRRMRAPNGEERDIHESQGQHFLSRGGRWV